MLRKRIRIRHMGVQKVFRGTVKPETWLTLVEDMGSDGRKISGDRLEFNRAM